ncbi:hypothetical protein [Caldimonas brevitalea]|uniref:Uncharacterized protein n=1 Tax=Caldimonas brevitalea TaxID=413882 RepID=A0A0G3BV57_9BURK|nr:hypothetical protein [Caldimonas brevitalea]AKJ31913.1 hypothetical protein AAW51_5222 [Caldimonas brevitalea]
MGGRYAFNGWDAWNLPTRNGYKVIDIASVKDRFSSVPTDKTELDLLVYSPRRSGSQTTLPQEYEVLKLKITQNAEAR